MEKGEGQCDTKQESDREIHGHMGQDYLLELTAWIGRMEC